MLSDKKKNNLTVKFEMEERLGPASATASELFLTAKVGAAPVASALFENR